MFRGAVRARPRLNYKKLRLSLFCDATTETAPCVGGLGPSVDVLETPQHMVKPAQYAFNAESSPPP